MSPSVPVATTQHRYLLLLRIAQTTLTLLILILISYASSVFARSSVPAYDLTFFTTLWTIVFLGWWCWLTRGSNEVSKFNLLRTAQRHTYNTTLIIFSIESLTVLWWLVTFILTASNASSLTTLGEVQGVCEYTDEIGDCEERDGYVVDIYGGRGRAAVGCTKAAAGLGALVFFFFSASLIITARRLDWSGMRAFGPEPAMVDDGEKGIAVQEQPQQRQPDEVAALRFSQHQPAAAV